MKRLLILVSLILTASLVGQDVQHAPTVAQCQADQRLWLSEVEGDSSQLPNFSTISAWGREMTNCEKVDPDNQHKYYNTAAEIMAEQESRLMDFVNRHGLGDKFVAEDAVGKR